MATAFRRRGDRIRVGLDLRERVVVADLLEQTRQLLEQSEPVTDADSAGGDSSEYADPALRRLLPAGLRGDPEGAAEFRELTEQTVRRRKTSALSTAIEALQADEGEQDGKPGAVDLTLPQSIALLTALADVRLVLGERLELRTDADSERLADMVLAAEMSGRTDDPDLMVIHLYDFLGWLQESLVAAVDR